MSTNEERRNSARPEGGASSDDAAKSPTGDPPPDDGAGDQGNASGEPEEAAGKTSDPVEDARAEVARIRDQLLRTAADYDNFRKRTRRELEDAQKRGKEDLLRELLPVFDNLERAVVHAGQASDPKAVADGVGMVLKQFADTLGRIGIKRVPTVGSAFDPAQHEAIQQLETDDHPPGTIVAEVQPGYAIGDKLVRAAMVVVAKPSRKNGEGEKIEPN
jgi:molecular chaperone GrpE